jgi:integrase
VWHFVKAIVKRGTTAVPANLHMTWVPSGRRWTKKYKGTWYAISCKKLKAPETKEGSWKAANAWWEAKQKEIDDAPPAPPSEQEVKINAFKVWSMVEDWKQLDEASRERLVDALVGAGQYQRFMAQAQQMDEAAAEATPPDRTIGAQRDAWVKFLRGVCSAGQMSEGRYDAYVRNVGVFVRWAGPQTPIDAIDEAKLEGYFTHLSLQVGAEKYSASYAHTLLMTAKQFVSRMAELKLIPLPGNIRSRRLRFNHSAAAKIETFTAEEVRGLLAACDGFSERTKLYLLLMLNCGMYQNDIAEMRRDEVDWSKGTVTRARSKTRERKGPVVTYKLWPETFVLLKKHKAKQGDLALTTDEGKPLVCYWLEKEGEKAGEMRRYDVIQSAWSRLAAKMKVGKIRLGMKHLRKTAATALGRHPHYKFFANHFLADSPRTVADRHYVTPNDGEFFAALDWLRGELLGA